MQMEGASQLELRLMACLHRCETELPASDLESTIASCQSDAATELQRMRSIIETISAQAQNAVKMCYPHVQVKPWAKFLEIIYKNQNEYWVRWTGDDGIYRWLHPLDNRWIEEPHQIDMPCFSNFAAARLAADFSPEPPTWKA